MALSRNAARWPGSSSTPFTEALYVQFNTARPEDFRGHSLSVSDIVAPLPAFLAVRRADAHAPLGDAVGHGPPRPGTLQDIVLRKEPDIDHYEVVYHGDLPKAPDTPEAVMAQLEAHQPRPCAGVVEHHHDPLVPCKVLHLSSRPACFWGGLRSGGSAPERAFSASRPRWRKKPPDK